MGRFKCSEAFNLGFVHVLESLQSFESRATTYLFFFEKKKIVCVCQPIVHSVLGDRSAFESRAQGTSAAQSRVHARLHPSPSVLWRALAKPATKTSKSVKQRSEPVMSTRILQTILQQKASRFRQRSEGGIMQTCTRGSETLPR